jgi:cytochrome c oxidase subunit 3
MTARSAACKTPFDNPAASATARRFGMVLFIISLGVLFAATAIALAIVRVQLWREGLWPDDLPELPRALWASTGLLAISALTMLTAQRAAAAGQALRLRLALHATTALGVAFLVVQIGCWWLWHQAVSQRLDPSDAYRLALTGFYVFSGLHALHVLGGIAALIVTAHCASQGRYTADHHPGVRACALYWHFLEVVWVVLFALLLWGT